MKLNPLRSDEGTGGDTSALFWGESKGIHRQDQNPLSTTVLTGSDPTEQSAPLHGPRLCNRNLEEWEV